MGKKILFLDDSKTMRQVAEITFAGTAYEVVLAGHAEEGWQKAQTLLPALIVLDAGLQNPSAYEWVRRCKENASLQSTPILLLTSQFHPFDPELAQQSNIENHTNKPFEIQNFLDKIDAIFQKNLPKEEPLSEHTKLGIPVFKAPPLAQTTISEKPAAVPTKVVPSVAVSAAPPVSPSAPLPIQDMPRAPLLPRAPLPATVVATLERIAAKGAAYEAIAQLSREVIEQIVWDVVPELAEAMIRAEMQRSRTETSQTHG